MSLTPIESQTLQYINHGIGRIVEAGEQQLTQLRNITKIRQSQLRLLNEIVDCLDAIAGKLEMPDVSESARRLQEHEAAAAAVPSYPPANATAGLDAEQRENSARWERLRDRLTQQVLAHLSLPVPDIVFVMREGNEAIDELAKINEPSYTEAVLEEAVQKIVDLIRIELFPSLHRRLVEEGHKDVWKTRP